MEFATTLNTYTKLKAFTVQQILIADVYFITNTTSIPVIKVDEKSVGAVIPGLIITGEVGLVQSLSSFCV
ncbi:hypothetical protein [Virgibacillus tibetensis]|uniref:hypothetical protein n=1 Tax=Virgibacillus tibetensis TaxID=3042313 RepID=UPI002E16DD79